MADEMKRIIDICLSESSKSPVKVLRRLMAEDFCTMHGPIHHVLVGSSLLTAFKNSGGKVDLPAALTEIQTRATKVPGGACGNWGACGAAISTGMFLSIVTGNSPLAVENWGLANRMTASSLNAIGEIGGPRCCKRDSYLSIMAAVNFVRENLGVEMESEDIKCSHSAINKHCIGRRCPFLP